MCLKSLMWMVIYLLYVAHSSYLIVCAQRPMDCFDHRHVPSIPNSKCIAEINQEMQAFTRWRCNCSNGYSLENPQRNLLFCYPDNKTSPDPPVCVKSCIVPMPYHNRWINAEFGTEILSGDSVIERCLNPPPGLKQARILTCRDGQWSTLWLSTSCALELCAPTPLLANSMYRCLQSTDGFNNETELKPVGSTKTTQCFEGGKAVYHCKDGFQSDPALGHKMAVAHCGFGGKWSPIFPHDFRCDYSNSAAPRYVGSIVMVVLIYNSIF